MKYVAAVLAAIAAVVLAVALWGVGTYNHLVSLREGVNSSWAQVQNVYQRRADLVPNLVATVKGAARFEKSTLLAVTEARAKVGSMQIDAKTLNDPALFQKFEAAQGQLGAALQHLMVVMERYPELKATENFRDLQVQLEGTENRIAVERRNFNEAARQYNAAIKSFPGVLVASFGGFQERPYFQAEAAAQTAPKVKF